MTSALADYHEVLCHVCGSTHKRIRVKATGYATLTSSSWECPGCHSKGRLSIVTPVEGYDRPHWELTDKELGLMGIALENEGVV
jgi:hypothetical protein